MFATIMGLAILVGMSVAGFYSIKKPKMTDTEQTKKNGFDYKRVIETSKNFNAYFATENTPIVKAHKAAQVMGIVKK